MWACPALFLFCAVMSIRAGQTWASAVFIFFAAPGVYVLLTTGPLEVGRNSITYRTPLARYRIGRDEVSYVELDRQGGGIVFCGIFPVNYRRPHAGRTAINARRGRRLERG